MPISIKFPDGADGIRSVIEAGISQGISDSICQGTGLEEAAVDVVSNPSFVIPAFGVGGVVTSPYYMTVFIDVSQIHEPDFHRRVARIVTHEFNHLARTQSGHRIATLGEALVSEGFAQAAEVAAGHEPAFYSLFESETMQASFSQHARNHLQDLMQFGRPDSPYARWFYGDKNDARYPPYGGYALGYKIVSQYLAGNGLTVAAAPIVSAKAVLDEWKMQPD